MRHDTLIYELLRLFEIDHVKCTDVRGDRWIPRTKSQYLGKCLHLRTSSGPTNENIPLVIKLSSTLVENSESGCIGLDHLNIANFCLLRLLNWCIEIQYTIPVYQCHITYMRVIRADYMYSDKYKLEHEEVVTPSIFCVMQLIVHVPTPMLV